MTYKSKIDSSLVYIFEAILDECIEVNTLSLVMTQLLINSCDDYDCNNLYDFSYLIGNNK